MNKEVKREIIKTGDGSTTIHLHGLNEQYHSKHGAINEAKHVFIAAGLHHVLNLNTIKTLHLLEIGFGTGLNTFLTFLEAKELGIEINYVGIEGYPVSFEEVQSMNYPGQLNVPDQKAVFDFLHQTTWNKSKKITSHFSLTKRKQFFRDIRDTNEYHLIYFDAFGARVQPELWTVEIFKKMYNALRDTGVLVTYSAKGSVRRAMQEVGFDVERLPGPPSKREMLRATKKIANKRLLNL
ncbi:tRNA (5-methylaminomethyl-2-thiouridine)(34)-methyltransferase MnmD [Aquimarina sp. U1-2]|uniref:tRNA (5-methylaminomethyl-2-thiouridine)(34)-methyltransferase MnmD n=1 Tax=Aquimarina sp. U1-2 TaxID=2823141 RepID=UPI001AED082F|nr:tRNA (5-methylaminomethyl-2-thiouridine)(34)-methyltransferase MnmD [Aquimarina sp. U1-2]MBP2834180.1 tRNA (5-methylaminomethyl-2-thiouridine)(34)-methyltransferase MnmD [Aquimarina sp. U1-2]